MANKLITTFFTFITLSSLAQQPNNAELLAHLKNVRTEIAEDLHREEISNESIFALKLASEFYAESKPLQQYISETVNEGFNFICNDLKKWDQLFYLPPNNQGLDIIFNAKEQYVLFESIYTKLHKNYCSDNPNGPLVKVSAHDVYEEFFNLVVFLDGLLIPNELAKKIDAKIAELEKTL